MQLLIGYNFLRMILLLLLLLLLLSLWSEKALFDRLKHDDKGFSTDELFEMIDSSATAVSILVETMCYL
jgi:hypothetical protein